ncbi:hypothetical protein SAMN05216436_11098 [bacterium A37T11]|nr:hypothetical protein SAMN05216436_11098 [bacterium A37T11]
MDFEYKEQESIIACFKVPQGYIMANHESQLLLATLKITIAFLLGLFIKTSCFAQIEAPVKMSYVAKRTSATEAVLFFKATIDEGRHIYSVNQGDGGPIKTSFKFTPSKDYSKTGKVIEPKLHTAFEEALMMEYFHVYGYDRATKLADVLESAVVRMAHGTTAIGVETGPFKYYGPENLR